MILRNRARRRMLPLLALAFSLLGASGAGAQPLTVGGDPRVDPADFEITVFASGLDFPLSMQELADGAVLVGVSPWDGTPGGNFRDSEGELLRLEDADGDGVADDAGTALYAGLPGAVTSLRLIADLAFVASINVVGAPHITILRQGAGPTDPFTLIGSVDFSYPLPWSHFTISMAAREVAGLPGRYELYFQIGSRENTVATTATVSYSGLASGTANADALYRLEIDDTGPALAITGVTQIAKGVRNAFGLAFSADGSELYFEDNGYIGQTDVLMTDELNRLSAAELGGAIEDFGFPDNYILYRTGVEIGSGGVDPVVAFQPVPPPNGAESRGVAEIAFAPPGFPPGLDSGMFVGFHGSFGSAGAANVTNPVVYVDLDTLEHFHFISNDQTTVGHPDGLLATHDSLFVADFTNANGLGTFGSGTVYQIRALPPAVPSASGWLLGLVAAALAGLGARAARPVRRAS